MLQLLLTIIYFFSTIFAAPVSVYNYPDPEPCLGNCSWIHDPNIINKDGTYYRFSTSGNIAIATAPSIAGPWTYRGALLDNGTSIFVVENQDVWAPDVILLGDTYYAYYSVSWIGVQTSQIGVATSKSLDPGSWTDHGSFNLPLSTAYNLIDPHVFRDSPSSPIYFTFGSYWRGIYQTTLDAGALTSFSGDEGSLRNIIGNTTSNPQVLEGAVTFKHARHYYVFFSAGNCCAEPPNLAPPGGVYRVVVCRAESVQGPYVDRQGRNCLTQNGGTIVLASHGDVYAPGGQGVLEGENRDVVMYYHYVRPSVGYAADQFFFGWNYLDFSTGWPVVVR